MSKKNLCTIMALCAALFLAMPVFAEDSSDIYVSNLGNDKNTGTIEEPVATLSKAVELASDGSTVHVMSDLVLTKCARFYDKTITIESYGENIFTLSRGQSFTTSSDPARGQYNPALIEVQETGKECGIVLNNIILDDLGKHEGTVYSQAISDGGKTENTKYVQDGIISSNATNKCTIILGDGAVLRNYGGMSAVRVTDQAKLLMKSGSIIEDSGTLSFERGSEKNGTGPAGAIWVQGAEIQTDAGSYIRNTSGRAVYLDSGKATLDGTIINIKPIKDKLWQSYNGYAMHLRGISEATLCPNFIMDNSGITTEGNSAFSVNSGCKLTMEEGAVIKNLYSGSAITGASKSDININGEITNMRPTTSYGCGHVLNIQGEFKCVIGSKANLHHNYVTYGTVYAQGKNGSIEFHGKINDNFSTDRGGGIVLANNAGPTYCTMYEGAEICRNYSSETGGGVMSSTGVFRMKGGKITNNVAKLDGGGVFVRRGGSFIMEGGIVENNICKGIGGGIDYEAVNYLGIVPVVKLDSGIIRNNMMSANVSGDIRTGSITAEGGISNDLSISSSGTSTVDRSLLITNAKVGNKKVYFEKYDFNLEFRGNNCKIGNPKSESIEELKNIASEKKWNNKILASFWYDNESSSTTFELSDVKNIDSTLPVYAISIPTDESGNPIEGKNEMICAVDDSRFTLLSNNVNEYAVAIVQPTIDYGSLTISGPDLIEEIKDESDYPVNYVIDYQISDNFKNIIKTSGAIPIFKLRISPDRLLIGNPNMDNFDGNTISVEYIFKAGEGEDVWGSTLVTSALLTIEVGNEIYTIPAKNKRTSTMPFINIQFPIYFDANGGKLVDTVSPILVTNDEKLSKPNDPIREGYNFVGWYLEDEAYDFGKVVNTSFTLKAKWSQIKPSEPHKYILTYVSNGGTEYNPEYYKYNDEVELNKEPERKGYKFKGWFLDKNLTQPVNELKMISSKIVYAGWDTIDLNTVPKWLNGEDHLAYIYGYPDKSIKPGKEISRAEASAIIYRLLDEDIKEQFYSEANSFEDVDKDYWCNTEISTLSKMGIIKGYSSSCFGPENPITRAEFAVIFERFDNSKIEHFTSFSDIDNHWARSEIEKSASLGWIKGYKDGSFRPNNSITRAEAITMINRVLNRGSLDISDLNTNMKIWSDNPTGTWYYIAIQEATNSHEYIRTDGNNEVWTDLIY